MTLHKLESLLTATLDALRHEGRLKGTEHVITGMRPPSDRVGPRYLLQGYGDRAFSRMHANAYPGLNAAPWVIAAEEAAAQRFGTAPGEECQHAY